MEIVRNHIFFLFLLESLFILNFLLTNYLKKFNKTRLVLFLAVLGPGLITAMADNDAGGVATYTVAASMYGMASQYFIVLTTLLLAFTQEAGARIAVVTGKGLADLIREHSGVKAAVIIFGFYFIVNQGVVLQDVSGLKAAIQLMNVPWQPTLILACLLLVLMVIKLNFKNLQRIFLFMILFYGTYIVSAFLTHPNWTEAMRESLFFPRKVSFSDVGYWFTLIAVLGTTVTAWGQFFVNGFVADEGIRPENLKEEKVEIYFSAVLTNVFSWLIAIAVTYTLFVNHILVRDGYTAALAIKPLAGNLSYGLFSVGLFAASLLGLTIVPLATAYAFTEFFGYERSLNTDFSKGRVFYTIFALQIIFGLIVTLFPAINLFKLTLYADFLNGAILPIIFYYVIKFSENKEIMGAYVSRGFSSFFIRASAVVISIAVVATFMGKFIFKLG